MAEFTVRVVVGFLALVVLIAVLGANAEGAAWYEALKDWQTGLGAFAGLLAILVGALYNADLTRQRDDRLRADEAMRVARALYAEVNFMRGVVEARNDFAKKISAEGAPLTPRQALVLDVPRPLVYPNAAQHVGLLPRGVVVDLVELYARVNQIAHIFGHATKDPTFLGFPIGKDTLDFYERTLQLIDAVLPRLKKAAKLA